MKEALEQIRRTADELIAAAADEKAVDELRVRFWQKRRAHRHFKADGQAFRRGAAGHRRSGERGARGHRRPHPRPHERFAEAALTARLPPRPSTLPLPGTQPVQGGLHPFHLVLSELKDIFLGMGFDVVEGPEVELDHYNFEMLNMPKSHPCPRHAGYLLHHRKHPASHSDQSHADPHHGAEKGPHPHHRAGPGLPLRRRGRHPFPCSTRSRAWWWTRASPLPI